MEKKAQELIYYAITVVSIVLCLLLVGVMMLDRGETTTSTSEEQRFSEVEIMEEKPREIILTQEEIAAKLSEMLPEPFSKNAVNLEINGNTTVRSKAELLSTNTTGNVENYFLGTMTSRPPI